MRADEFEPTRTRTMHGTPPPQPTKPLGFRIRLRLHRAERDTATETLTQAIRALERILMTVGRSMVAPNTTASACPRNWRRNGRAVFSIAVPVFLSMTTD